MYDETLSFGQVLGDSIRQVGRHWIFFLGIGLANVLLYLPGSYLASHMAMMGSDSYATNLLLVYGINFLNVVVTCLIYGTIIDFVNQVYHQPRPSVADAVRLAVRRWPAVVWTMVVRWFWLILGFMLLIIPGILWGYRQMLCWVVTTVEGISGPAALRRAQALMNADTSVYGILFGHWLLCTILCLVPSTVAGYALIHQSVAVRTAVQSSAGVVGWLLYGVYYFAMVRVYVYLRQRLDCTPEDDGVGFSPTFEL